ncbi:glycosyltransferase family 4 protein [Pedobacter zeae]|uniref:Glycosyl transferase n=1 Tax=Pedobacter zeae TaxID=1737356 RepID=A0A7W6KBZ6_9SPHI|nr:glycosyltransferase family 4 protein [Pedobacter zeae]MBB4107792.1 glycosyltransferase involved in cell wall biosynthesis [Pedobacter zeae]GGG97024.1 glycosyl transferase [Pedobacter zeae]
MKIAITADPEIAVPPLYYGGIERIVHMIICELVNLGHDVTLFANRDSSVPCKLEPYSSSESSKATIVQNSWLITKKTAFKNFDIVHSFGRLAYLLPLMPLKIAKLMSYQREPTLLQIKRAMALAKKGSMRFSGCSNYITNQILSLAPANTVYNGVDFSKYSYTTSVEDDAPLVFLGRIEPIKGTHTAIEIALKTKRRLIIAGNIPNGQQTYFDKEIKPFLGEQINYVGAVNDIQKNEILSKAAALLMPIHWQEPFGIVMVEAMACGTPVIGLSKGAVIEVVENNITGYYASETAELVERMAEIKKISRAQVYQVAKARFSAEEITQQYLKLYQKF